MTIPHSNAEPVALITGGARGLGLGIAERLATDGAVIHLCDLDESALADAGRILGDQGFDSHLHVCDVSKADEVEIMAERIAATTGGRLDVLVNNAGISARVNGQNVPVESMPVTVWQQTLDVNLNGAFLVSRALIPLIKNSPAGRIINISSRVARTGAMSSAAYAVSKAGVTALSRALARELGAHGVTVNCVAPSRIPTALTQSNTDRDEKVVRTLAETPLGRLGTIHDVAAAVAFLASPDAAFITGAILDVNGGSFMPS